MTFNIRAGNGNLDGIAAAIRAAAPDIVALQEVDVHWSDRSDFVDEASALAGRLEMQARFAPIYRLSPSSDTLPPREFGVALLSRFPIVSWANDSLMRLSTQEPNPAPRRMPGLLEAVLNVHGTLVRVLNTHLDYRSDPHVRSEQALEMVQVLDDLAMPTIVFGDMNAKPNAPELQPLLHRLHDSWNAATDSGFTYPAEQPTERIDYILVDNIRVLSTRVVATLASDHRPVVADLVLAPADPSASAPPG
jgi:endonuclease/exonuclease/phosphatase family metal-dependent hydrolase